MAGKRKHGSGKTAGNRTPKKRPRATAAQSGASTPSSGLRTERDRADPEREREEPETLIPGAEDDDLAEELGEESVEAATSGQTPAEENLNEEVPEETGGPFVETSGRTVYGYGTDPRSRPDDTRRGK